MPISNLIAISSFSDAFTEFITVANSAFTFIISNWYLSAIIVVPLGGLVIGSIISMLRR